MNSLTKLPINIGAIHFVGIGGIGMSGIAEVLLNLNYKVQGSDIKKSPITERLEKLGINIFYEHHASNLKKAAVVVISTAVSESNPELIGARNKGIPIVKRSEMLAELMRLNSNIAIAGTHGKTTTTTLVATLLDGGELDPTVINGGIIHAYGSNARLGQGDWMVVEADESDGTFNRLPATLAVVTNIDPEHLDHWGDFEMLRKAFLDFVSNIPFYGVAFCCTDHPEVQALVGKVTDRRIITYGFNAQADVRAVNVTFMDGISYFDVLLQKENITLDRLSLPMPGNHNVSNSLAAIAIARHLDINEKSIKKSLSQFKGVNRRFTQVAELNGMKIIDDYGHHPVEISAVLRAARQTATGKVFAIHQPHRYTRLKSLFHDFCSCFNEADFVVIMEVYSAGEAPLDGASRADLVNGLVRHGHRNVFSVDDEDELEALIREQARSGDIIVFLGAGTISVWANNLPFRLNDLG
ncbi:MAG: UDP-N-acetylmuramate--L-alanine ligase [Paracoccaceae bacterium]